LIVGNDDLIDYKLRDIILFDMAGCALLTLLINGTTAGKLISRIGLTTTTPTKKKVFNIFLEGLLTHIGEFQNKLKTTEKYLNYVDWEAIPTLVGCDHIRDLIKENEASIKQMLSTDNNGSLLNLGQKKKTPLAKRSVGDISEYDVEDDENLIIETRNRFLMTLKGVYYQMFEVHQCSPDTYLQLLESANWDLDTEKEPMNSWDFITNHFFDQSTIQLLFGSRNWPIVGKIARSWLFNHLSFLYDVASSYIAGHEKAESIARESVRVAWPSAHLIVCIA
jgi:hypothetical protein